MANESETELSPLALNVKSIFIEMLVSMKTANTMFVLGVLIVQTKLKKASNSTHFTFNLDNTPNYACLKSDCKEACLGCDSVVLREKGLYDCYVFDLGGSFFTFANIRPNAKAHCVMSRKKHIKDFQNTKKVTEMSVEQKNINQPLPSK
ncbi:hypothetical protein G9A89_012863 [Geosiphon pyriformis]|nr:hypothetical protein G9A89_012863 [Geosiphon pyriformis]